MSLMVHPAPRSSTDPTAKSDMSGASGVVPGAAASAMETAPGTNSKSVPVGLSARASARSERSVVAMRVRMRMWMRAGRRGGVW